MKKFDAAAYTVTVKKIFVDGDYCFYSSVAEIPDISSYSDSWNEAYENAIESLEILHADACEQGKVFPSAFNSGEKSSFSGRVTLRMSRSMHADVTRCAEEDGVSLNQWIVESISQRRGANTATASTSMSAYRHLSSSTAVGRFIEGFSGSFKTNQSLVLNPSDSHRPYHHISTAS